MNQQQKEFFRQVIRPVLVKLAMEDELPQDMNDICYTPFEEAAEEFNRNNPPKILVKVDGGVVQDVIQNIGEAVEVDVIDGDIEATDKSELIEFEDKEYYIYQGEVGVYSPQTLKKFEG